MSVVSSLFEDRVVIRSVNNSKFEKVSRIKGKSTAFDADVVLDVHTDIFPLMEKESLYLALTSQISSTTSTNPMWDPAAASLIDQYDYVMYGKIFRSEDKSSERRTVYASFGGLLMSITADKQVVGELSLDMRLYLLLKRSTAPPSLPM